MSEKQTKNTKEILSNIWNWEHTEDGGRRAIPNPHSIKTKIQMIEEILGIVYPDVMVNTVVINRIVSYSPISHKLLVR